jgi:hypothetical protein
MTRYGPSGDGLVAKAISTWPAERAKDRPPGVYAPHSTAEGFGPKVSRRWAILRIAPEITVMFSDSTVILVLALSLLSFTATVLLIFFIGVFAAEKSHPLSLAHTHHRLLSSTWGRHVTDRIAAIDAAAPLIAMAAVALRIGHCG